MKYKIKLDLFPVYKSNIKEEKIRKISSFQKGFFIAFIPLYIAFSLFFFYKTDEIIKNFTQNYKNDIFFSLEKDKTSLSLTILNETIILNLQ